MATPTKSPNRPFFAFNHACLDDKTQFSYRELQRLCKQLQLKASGKRELLVERLQEWHRDEEASGREVASNFAALEVKVISPSRGTLVPDKLLSPLIKKKARRRPDGTPIGILSPTKYDSNRPRKNGMTKKKKKRLKFSMFNGVKMIPGKESGYPRNCLNDCDFDAEMTQEDLDVLAGKDDVQKVVDSASPLKCDEEVSFAPAEDTYTFVWKR